MIAVVGSLDLGLDLVVPVPRHPVPGGTVLARHPGGKGAHQAVAAARLGGETASVGLLGDDEAAGVIPAAVRPVDTAADGDSSRGAPAVALAEGRTPGQPAR
ncbi:PfkB family carbohydrate kinase [Streptomyces fungicidicus]